MSFSDQLVTSSACLQFLGFRSHDGGHFATMHTVPFLLLFSFWLGHATSFPRRFFMTLEVAPPPKPRKSALGTRLWGMQMLQFIPAWLGFVQTDATTPNIVACVRVGSGVQTDAATPNNVGTCGASWEGYNP